MTRIPVEPLRVLKRMFAEFASAGRNPAYLGHSGNLAVI
jgi:hypothetical protein